MAPLPDEAAPPPTEWSVAQTPRSLFAEPAAQPLASAGASSLRSSAAPARTAAPALPGAAQDVRSASLAEAGSSAPARPSEAFADPPTLATGESPFALEGAPPGAAPSEPRTEAPAAAPLVEIGSIEIVIEEAARAPGAAPEAPARAADFASRFYLRGL